jgi:hypothetical protein
MTSFWVSHQGEQLEQGDYLPGCWIPMVGADFDPASAEPEIAVGRSNLVIVTQSCDLANDKIQLAALCPLADLATWERLNPDYAKRGFWESVRQGRREGLHMLSAFTDAGDGRNALVVDFSLAIALTISRAFFPSLRPIFHARWSADRDSRLQVIRQQPRRDGGRAGIAAAVGVARPAVWRGGLARTHGHDVGS